MTHIVYPPMQCEKHGIQRDAIRINVGSAADGSYCQRCWAEWMKEHVTQLVPVYH